MSGRHGLLGLAAGLAGAISLAGMGVGLAGCTKYTVALDPPEEQDITPADDEPVAQTEAAEQGEAVAEVADYESAEADYEVATMEDHEAEELDLNDFIEDVMEDAGEEASEANSIYGYTMERIDGGEESLSEYAGSVVLVVNVASKCGLTPHYEGLEELYEAKKGEGLVVLGFPANNFGGQEPGSNEEIAHFCEENYGVTFPMFAKISVVGDDQHPMYAMLSAQSEPPNWNFTKYLVGRDGQLVQRFGPRTSPDDEALLEAIEGQLAVE